MLATRVRELPTGDNWQYEVKWDGYRMEAIKNGDQVQLWSRNQTNYSKRFQAVANDVGRISAKTAVLDGEIVAIDGHGGPCFQVLQGSKKLPPGCSIVFYAFDLLFLNGENLKDLPLIERRSRLVKLVKPCKRVRFSGNLEGDANTVMEVVRQHGLEGVVAKKKDSIYLSGRRSSSWLKLLLKEEEEFIIGGYRPLGRNFEILLVGRMEEGKFVFTGKVQQGFNPRIRADIFKVIKSFESPKCQFVNLPNSKTDHFGETVTSEEMAFYVWLRPEVVAEIKFTEWTRANVLRQAEFVELKGLAASLPIPG